MAEITAALVKELREQTGAGMMDCKKALVEADGNLQDAVDWLRKKGLSSAAKKSGRVAAEGLVGVASAPNRAAMVEINAETDFVARNESFQHLVETVARIALDVGDDIEAIKAAPFPGANRSVAEEITHLVATVGENMILRRAARLNVASGVVATYASSPRWKPSVARSACISPPPGPMRWKSARWTRPPWNANARCFPNRPAPPASRRPSSKRWSMVV
jgi:elongation factor Ts